MWYFRIVVVVVVVVAAAAAAAAALTVLACFTGTYSLLVVYLYRIMPSCHQLFVLCLYYE